MKKSNKNLFMSIYQNRKKVQSIGLMPLLGKTGEFGGTGGGVRGGFFVKRPLISSRL